MQSGGEGEPGKLESGWLIAFEGIDGAGKTTQVDLLADALREEGRVVHTTREPTDGKYGSRIRQLSSQAAPLSLEEELDLFIEDRKEHIRELIAPALARGEVVISDRYYLSSVAYQGARGLSPADLLARNEALFPPPTAAILLEVSADRGLDRVRTRGESRNLAYERADFLTQVVEIYAGLDRPYLVRVPGDDPPAVVHEAVLRALAPLIRPR